MLAVVTATHAYEGFFIFCRDSLFFRTTFSEVTVRNSIKLAYLIVQNWLVEASCPLLRENLAENDLPPSKMPISNLLYIRS